MGEARLHEFAAFKALTHRKFIGSFSVALMFANGFTNVA
ncbi:hypothetical protein OKW41_003138 [Paraburkholderia sp. UCT70]